MKKTEGALTEVLAELRAAAQDRDGDRVSVDALIRAVDERGYGAALAVLPLIELTPVGGIPTLPTLLALTLAIVTIRLFLGYEHIWAPAVLRRRTLSTDRVEDSLKKLRPISLRIDAKLHERFSWLMGKTPQRAACLVILCLLLTVPPLELIPFATSVPMIVISVFGLAILFRDGLLMGIGFAGAAAAAMGGVWLLLGSG